MGWIGGGGSMEPAGLNSTAEPLTPTIHQCRGVTRQEQGCVCVRLFWGVGGGGGGLGERDWGAIMGFGTWTGLVTGEWWDKERKVQRTVEGWHELISWVCCDVCGRKSESVTQNVTKETLILMLLNFWSNLLRFFFNKCWFLLCFFVCLFFKLNICVHLLGRKLILLSDALKLKRSAHLKTIHQKWARRVHHLDKIMTVKTALQRIMDYRFLTVGLLTIAWHFLDNSTPLSGV